MIAAHKLLGKKKFIRNASEKKSKIFKRSIFVVKDIDKGEKLTKRNIRRIRPGYGLEPKYYFQVLGKKVNSKIKLGEPLLKKKIIL